MKQKMRNKNTTQAKRTGSDVSFLPGSYLPGESLLHRLDGRAKLAGFLLLLASVILTSSAAGYAVLLFFFAALLKLSRLPPRPCLAAVSRLWGFFILIFLMNSFFQDGGTLIWTCGILRLTREGVLQGANVVLRVILIVLFGNLMLCTTSPIELTSALTWLLRPLALLRLPADDIAMILTVAIRFIPTLAQETELIKKAQTARGARFESGSLIERAKSYAPLVVPIFLSAFRKADELAMAMEARGYQGGRRQSGGSQWQSGGSCSQTRTGGCEQTDDAHGRNTGCGRTESSRMVRGRTADSRGRNAMLRGRTADSRGRNAILRGRTADSRGRNAMLRGRTKDSRGRNAMLRGRIADSRGRNAMLRGRAADSRGRISGDIHRGTSHFSGCDYAALAVCAALCTIQFFLFR